MADQLVITLAIVVLAIGLLLALQPYFCPEK